MKQMIETGIICARQGKPAEAFKQIERAAQAFPEEDEPHYLLGSMLASRGQHAEAISRFHHTLTLNPCNLDARQALIFSLRRLARYAEAEAETNLWAEADPASPGPLLTRAHIFLEQGHPDAALVEARKACTTASSNSNAKVLTAHILAQLGRNADAIWTLTDAIRQIPDNAELHLYLGNLLKREGMLEDARNALHKVLKFDPGNTSAFFELAEITRFQPIDGLLADMESAAAAEAAGRVPISSRLHFALGKAYDDIGRYDDAFGHFAIANAHETSSKTYSEKHTLAVLERMQQIFPPDALARLQKGGHTSRLPVFIIGMPRSGTTLVEQIIASHQDVAAGGEHHHFIKAVEIARHAHLPACTFPDGLEKLDEADVAAIAKRYLNTITPLNAGRARLTDKLPANGLLMGLIHSVFPDAAIIHCRRDPADTCLSCYMKAFGARVPYSADLRTLGRYYRAHEKLMAYWHSVLPPGSVLEMHYEDLVSDFENQVRRLVAHCGLTWDACCLAFHENRRGVATASLAQVREPVYTHSVGRWRNYKSHLPPLLSALGGN